MPTGLDIGWSANSTASWPPANIGADVLHDGSINDTTTYAAVVTGTGASGGKSGTALIDLGSSQNVDQAKFTMSGDGDVGNSFQLQRSADGTTWTNVQGPFSYGGTLSSLDRTFTSVAARYWRVINKVTTSDNLVGVDGRIYDFRLFVGGAEYTIPFSTPALPPDLFLPFFENI